MQTLYKRNYDLDDSLFIANIILFNLLKDEIHSSNFKIKDKSKNYELGFFIQIEIGNEASCEIVEINCDKYYLVDRFSVSLQHLYKEIKAKEVIGN